MPETKAKNKRQLVEDARQAVLDGRWADALQLNQQITERFPRDAEAFNRLGRIYLQFQKYSAAMDAYSSALKVDPANMIARRNLQRLDNFRHLTEPQEVEIVNAEQSPIPRTAVFIEEVGKTWIDELVNPAPMDELAIVNSGAQLQATVDGQRLLVSTMDGKPLGEIEARTAERVIELMEGGNRYEIYALGLSQHSLRIILREVFHNPEQADKISFPRQLKASRDYLRERDLLRNRDEAEFIFHDEDEEEEEEEIEAQAEGLEEEESGENEAEAFIEEGVRDEDEDET